MADAREGYWSKHLWGIIQSIVALYWVTTYLTK